MFDYASRRRRLGGAPRGRRRRGSLPRAVGGSRVPDRRRAARAELRRSRSTRTGGSPAPSSGPARSPCSCCRGCSRPSTCGEQPEGEVVVVNETDDGFAVFERVARDAAGAGVLAVGDRIWAETTLHLGRDPRRSTACAPARALVNELRRIKSAEELDAMGRAIVAVEQTMAATAPLVVPGVSMAELAEAVEHELRARRLALPVVRDAHLHRARRGRLRLGDGDGAATRSRREPRSCSTSAASSTATPPTSAARSTAASRRPTTSRPTRSCSPRRRPAAPPRSRAPRPAR